MDVFVRRCIVFAIPLQPDFPIRKAEVNPIFYFALCFCKALSHLYLNLHVLNTISSY